MSSSATPSFRALTRNDFPLLSDWISAPHVQTWWREESDAESVEENYGPLVDGIDPGEVFIIERSGQPVGLIQRYRFSDNQVWQSALSVSGTPSNAVGIDYFIGLPHLTGHGLGPEVIERFVEQTWDRYQDIDAIVVSIQQDNSRSWRALEKVGFERAWTGTLESDDPSDEGISHVYILQRPASSVR